MTEEAKCPTCGKVLPDLNAPCLDCDATMAQDVEPVDPLGSLSESAEPLSPPTVENLTNTSVLLPTLERNLALVYLVTSAVTSKYPCAPAPFACTTRSGMRSRSKCPSFSSRCVSCMSTGPLGPAVSLFWSSPTGLPNAVVRPFLRPFAAAIPDSS